jgi:hypothetical protein
VATILKWLNYSLAYGLPLLLACSAYYYLDSGFTVTRMAEVGKHFKV